MRHSDTFKRAQDLNNSWLTSNRNLILKIKCCTSKNFQLFIFHLTHRSTTKKNNHDCNESEIAVAAAEFIKLELDDCKLPSMMQWKYFFINLFVTVKPVCGSLLHEM